ncbi:MAG: channel protein TolC [Leptothrix sp. (in: Bacteria)]|nr:channel protein TolC [Leptothrix sp. (in: b-proteobacteria)]
MRSNLSPRPSTLAAALLMTLPGFALAQSLQELYDAARAFDATYLAAKANAASVEYRAAQAEALRRPSLAATAGANATRSEVPVFGVRNTKTVSGALNGRYPLFNRANDASVEQARKSLVTAQADLDTAEQDLIVRVAQAYFDVLAAQDTLATTRANKAATAEQLASAKRNFEVGTATITDTREAQARFDLGTFQELAAENDLRTKRLALDTLVGRNDVTPKPLLAPVVLPPPVPANPEEWVTLADQGHPLVRRARIGLEVAELETSKARAAGSPTVDAVGALSATETRGTLQTFIPTAGVTTTASIGVQMNWPLYTGGATQNRVKETLLLEEKSRNDLEAARRGVGQGTRTAYFGVQSGLSQVKALEAAESSSQLALEATQLGYKVGVRVNLDVLNAQLQLFQTRRDLAKARYDVLVGSLKLRQASGQLAPPDIDAVNRLLAK